MSEFSYEDVEKISKMLLEKSPLKPKIGIICGTGLGGIVDTLDDKIIIEYKDIPGFPVSTVNGHAGRFVFGNIDGKSILCMQGRFHMYEGYHMSKVTLPVRVMKLMGIEVLMVTNAAGGLNPKYKAGDLMVLKDHIFIPNMAGNNPLVGMNDERFGVRFPAISNVYCKELQALANQTASNLNFSNFVHEGIYVMLGGPSFETIAECRLLRALGADAVGMSTCPEVVVAAHCGIKVFAMSMITNECVMDYEENRAANHDEVLETANQRNKQIQSFVSELVKAIPDYMLNPDKEEEER